MFEQTEAQDYPEIWYLGLDAKKIEGVQGAAQNNGYDDDNGSYLKVSRVFLFLNFVPAKLIYLFLKLCLAAASHNFKWLSTIRNQELRLYI